MPKKIIHILFICLIFLALPGISQTPNFKVSAFIQGSTGKKIFLGNKPKAGYSDPFNVLVLDSCYSINDSFSFLLNLKQPGFYSIEIEKIKGWCGFIATSDNQIHILGKIDSFYNSRILGSREDSLFDILTKKIIIPFYKSFSKAPKDSVGYYKMKIDLDKYNFIKQNPDSYVSAWNIQVNSINKLDSQQLNYLKSCYQLLTANARNFDISKNSYYNLFVAPKILVPDKKIPGFSFTNFDGNNFDIFKFLKKESRKYYLLDFWATWCGPCIAQFPKLRSIYDQYHLKGLEIIAYSLDTKKQKLQDFLSVQDIKWTVISDLAGDQSEVYKIFKLGTIPYNILIDDKGKIIATDISPENLLNLLEKRLGM